MPYILSTTTRDTLKLNHFFYEQAFEPQFMQRTHFFWQGKVSGEFKSDAEKQIFLMQLNDKEIKYVVFCGKATKKSYEQLKDNEQCKTLYFDAENVENNTVAQLQAILQIKNQAIFFVGQDGYGDNGIALFVIHCYEKLKEEMPHLFDMHYYQQAKKMQDYFTDAVKAFGQILLTCEKSYKQFIQFNKPAIAQVSQFVLAVEWVFQLIQQDLLQIEKAQNINLKLPEMFKKIETDYQKHVAENITNKAVRLIKNLTVSQDTDTLAKQLGLFRRYLKIIECCLGKGTAQITVLSTELIEKVKTFLLELPFGQVELLLKKALPKEERELNFNHEVISQQYELYSGNWLAQQNYAEAKPWLILAYLLTNEIEVENHLWKKLTELLSKTVKSIVSNAGTQGRTLLNSLEEFSLNYELSTKEKLQASGLDTTKQRRLAGKLFGLYSGMFTLSEELIVSTQQVSGKNGFFPPVLLLHDKAELAIRHLITYWKLLPKKTQLITGKKDRAYFALHDLVASARKISGESQEFLYQKLQSMGLPSECLELFPRLQQEAKSFYVAMQATTSSSPN